MASSNDIFNTVRDATDIVEIVSEHVALKRAGKEYVGLCPFHEDRRPSMHVVPQKQIFWCFVCATGGDVFKFVTLYHKMGYGEALRFLAQKKGIKLPELNPSGPGAAARSQDSSLREQIAKANEWACDFFERQLRTDACKPGLDYLHSRGLTDSTIEQFRLGMSPDKWTGLVDTAARLRLTGEQLEAAGLARRRGDGSPYDVFRNRVMFPIIDATNRVIAFGGRVLQEKRDETGAIVDPKYLNSPETKLFNKSEALYGLNHAKPAIIKSNQAVIVEGYMDVIACHQAGVHNVVATLGTSLTPQHASILRRFCQTIVLLFDSDDAGYRAADRAMEIFVRQPLDVKIASVPDGKDPCDFCMSHGGDAFAKVVAGAVDAMTYQWRRMQKVYQNNDSLSAQQEAVNRFVTFVAAAMAGQDMDPIRRGLLVGKIADLLGLTNDEVMDLLQKKSVGVRAAPVHQPEPDDSHEEPKPPPAQLPELLGRTAIEAKVLGSLLSAPPVFQQVREDLTLDMFSPEALQPLAGLVLEYLENSTDLAECSLADFLSVLGDSPLLVQAIQVQQQAEGLGSYEREVKEGVQRLAASVVSRSIAVASNDPASLLQIQQGVKGRTNPIPPNPYFRR
jgi:DNA primase